MQFPVNTPDFCHSKKPTDFEKVLLPIASCEPPTILPFSFVRKNNPLFDAVLPQQNLLVIRALQKELARSCQEASIECQKKLNDLTAQIASRDVKSVVGADPRCDG